MIGLVCMIASLISVAAFMKAGFNLSKIFDLIKNSVLVGLALSFCISVISLIRDSAISGSILFIAIISASNAPLYSLILALVVITSPWSISGKALFPGAM